MPADEPVRKVASRQPIRVCTYSNRNPALEIIPVVPHTNSGCLARDGPGRTAVESESTIGVFVQDNKTAVSEAGSTVGLEEIIISSELMSRPMRSPDIVAETAGMQALAAVIPEGDTAVFRRLAGLAIQLCGAGSAGVSVLEKPPSGESIFRWQVLAGAVAPFEGGATPRNWSPCGTCLDRRQAMLYSHPDRHFTYLRELHMPIVEALVVPMLNHVRNGSTIWIVTHDAKRGFDAEDARVMTTLGSYAARTLANLADGIPVAAPLPATGRESIWQAYLSRVARGDERSLTALLNETSPLVFATAIRIVGFAADAEEVTADVYARVWTIAANYNQERGTVSGWLRAIARSLSFDRLRASALKVRREVALRSDFCGTGDMEDDLIAGQAREVVLRALGGLPPVQRQAIEMAYLYGLTAPEIASTTGEPLGTIKTRIRLGLIKLRRLLASVERSGD